MHKSVYVGTSGWNYDHWDGRFYPEDIPKKRWFEFYSQEFSTVEVNYSYYRWPKEKTIRNWHDRAPTGFKFTMKAPRLITHVKRLKEVESYVKDFYALTSLLKEKSGCHLFQLPPSFQRTEENLHRLKTFLDSLDKRRDNAVEFRHTSWWDQDIYDLMTEQKVSFCTVSGLDMPDDTVVTDTTAYFRFHGKRYSTRYSEDDMKEYAKRIAELEADKVYCYFNNDANAYAIANARELSSEGERLLD
jgi:uncharacterized protein YecE (DUF72 family)